MQQSIILFGRMESFFIWSLENPQLHNYPRNAISSTLDITMTFRFSINWNILRQTIIYPGPFDPIPFVNGFIHTDGTWRMIDTSTVLLKLATWSSKSIDQFSSDLKFEGQDASWFEYRCDEKIFLNMSQPMPVLPNSAAGMYFLPTALQISSRLMN